MKASFKPILVALLFAVLLIASSYFFKGRSIGGWIDAAIYITAFYFIFIYFAGPPKACSVKPNNP